MMSSALQGINAQHEEFQTADSSSSRVGQGFSLDGLPPATDCNGHGTHISGTAAGLTYGVAKNAWIHPCEPLSQGLLCSFTYRSLPVLPFNVYSVDVTWQ